MKISLVGYDSTSGERHEEEVIIPATKFDVNAVVEAYQISIDAKIDVKEVFEVESSVAVSDSVICYIISNTTRYNKYYISGIAYLLRR